MSSSSLEKKAVGNFVVKLIRKTTRFNNILTGHSVLNVPENLITLNDKRGCLICTASYKTLIELRGDNFRVAFSFFGNFFISFYKH